MKKLLALWEEEKDMIKFALALLASIFLIAFLAFITAR